MSEAEGNAAEDPGFFDGRYLIEIETWTGNLHVGFSPSSTPQEYRFQGGLTYVRGFYLEGRFLAPRSHRSKPVRIWVSPFGEDITFKPDSMVSLGSLDRPRPGEAEHQLSILLPESALSLTATCLASVWKYLHVWTFAGDEEDATVRDYAFDASIHANLAKWAGV